MKLSIVYPVLNQHPLARVAIRTALENLSDNCEVELVVIDNGSDQEFSLDGVIPENKILQVQASVVRNRDSIGVYPTFWQGKINTYGDLIAFFHSDMIVAEKNWDTRVALAFEREPLLGLLGFIGSNEIDGSGGRGLGTTSNFLGGSYHDYDGAHTWIGSPAEPHGKRFTGYTTAAVVDGCAMIFKRDALDKIKQREDFPPHHFYDRMLSCEVMERGYKVGVLGIGCDHISGQTVAHEIKYENMAQEWCAKHGIAKTHNWDDAIYHEAERQWLTEYRDIKHLVPVTVY